MSDTSTEDARRDAAWEALKADTPNWSFGGSDRWVFGEAWRRAAADRDAAVARAQKAILVAMANYARNGDSAAFEERMFDAIAFVKLAISYQDPRP